MGGVTVPALRLLAFVLLVAATVCVLIGRNVCVRVSAFTFRSDWQCNNREYVTIHDWGDYQLEGHWFVFISSLVLCLYFGALAFVACTGKRIVKIESPLSVLACVICFVNGGLEAWYAAKGYLRRVPGFQAEGYVQSYIAASVGYFLVGLLSLGDAAAVFKGL